MLEPQRQRELQGTELENGIYSPLLLPPPAPACVPSLVPSEGTRGREGTPPHCPRPYRPSVGCSTQAGILPTTPSPTAPPCDPKHSERGRQGPLPTAPAPQSLCGTSNTARGVGQGPHCPQTYGPSVAPKIQKGGGRNPSPLPPAAPWDPRCCHIPARGPSEGCLSPVWLRAVAQRCWWH